MEIDELNIELIKINKERSKYCSKEENCPIDKFFLDRELDNFKMDLLNDVNSLLFSRTNSLDSLQVTNKKLTEDNEFLKQQLKELTDFLDVLVNVIKRQNQ